MAVAQDAAVTRPASRLDLGDAIRDAIFTGLIAFVLFGSMVAFKTESEQSVLVLRYRWEWAIGLTVAVALIRFLVDVFIWRGAIPIEVMRRSSVVRGLMSATSAVLPLLFVLGGVFFFVEGSRDVVTGMFVALSDAPAWQTRAATGFGLLMTAIMGLFMLVAAMLIARAGRLLLERVTPSRTEPRPLTVQSFTSDLLSELAPALLIIALVLPILVAGPQQRYALDTAIQVVTYIMLGWGLNVVVGLAGLLDLGYVAFYAVGAYSYALLSTYYGLSFWICLPLAGILAAFWGVLLGFPVLRLRGDYLAIVTLAFGEIIRVVLINWASLTGGPNGIGRIPKPTFFGIPFEASAEVNFSSVFGLDYSAVHRVIFFYYLILALALFTNFVTLRLRRLPIGRAWEALREDEIACRSLGINTVTTKLTAFAIGAAFAGLAGSFFATRQGFISPESFTFHESALILAIVVLGGMGSQMGVVIASIVLIGSSEFFRDLDEFRMLMFGGSMVLLMTWRPRGLVSSRTPSAVLKAQKNISASMVQEGRG